MPRFDMPRFDMHKFGLSALLLMFVTAATAIAQVERASIIGNVTDATGAVTPGVAITVTNEDTNTRIQMVTDDAGAYTAVNLIPGSYNVNAVRSGFAGGLPQLRAAGRPNCAPGHPAGSGRRRSDCEVTVPAAAANRERLGRQVISREAVNSFTLNGRNCAAGDPGAGRFRPGLRPTGHDQYRQTAGRVAAWRSRDSGEWRREFL
jgi:hypothetical protein